MTINAGKITALRTRNEQAFSYYLFRPDGPTKPGRILVSVHGITRNALEHAARLAKYCQANNILLIAPYFSRKRFRYFQTLKPDARGDRPSTALNAILTDVEIRMDINIDQFVMIGYSGGAQFAHRYALCHPEKISKLIINAAGWYTMPCFDTDYPEGLNANEDFSDLVFNVEKFCKIPISVMIGSKDTKREKSLNRSASIDAMQGRNRLTRGERWVNALNEFKREMGYKTDVVLKVIENSGHDFSSNIQNETYFQTLTNEIKT